MHRQGELPGAKEARQASPTMGPRGAPGAYATEVAEGEYLTLSTEHEGGMQVVYLERAGGSEVLAPRRRD
jgi:hypothetical protein